MSRSVVFAAILLGASLSGSWLSVTRVRAADASADIPGVPLSGSVATGLLGGPVYDVVYRLSVPAGSIVVASLSGTPETDFDLYAFDSTATTVQSNVGMIAKSTGPTSSESLSFPSALGGTYFIDLNGATELQGNYTLVVSIVSDPTPPTVVVHLAAGRIATSSLTVQVTLEAVDDLSGVTSMSFSSDGISYGAWLPFAPSTTWTFPAGDGQRTLWVRVQNGVGLTSEPAHASVMIDTVPPEVIRTEPSPGSRIAGLRPRFTVEFGEPIAPETWTSLGFILQSANGRLVAGSYAYDVAQRAGTFVPSADLVAGATYVATVGPVTDLAGNPVVAIGSWTVTPLVPTSTLATRTTEIITVGGLVNLAVRLTGAPQGASLDVLQRPSPGTVFEPLASLPVSDSGSASLSVHPTATTTYQFVYPGDDAVAGSQCDIRVIVRRIVGLVSPDGDGPFVGRAGRTVRLVAATQPAKAGVALSFRLYRFSTSLGRYLYAGSFGRSTDTNGRASLSWSPSLIGRYYWRVSIASTVELANNVSPMYRWLVRR